MTRIRPGIDACPDCGVRVLYAVTVTGDVIALDPAPGTGSLVVAWDCTDTPRCRVQPGGTLRDEEHRHERHALACLALPPVRVITSARSRRRAVLPQTERRHASAR